MTPMNVYIVVFEQKFSSRSLEDKTPMYEIKLLCRLFLGNIILERRNCGTLSPKRRNFLHLEQQTNKLSLGDECSFLVYTLFSISIINLKYYQAKNESNHSINSSNILESCLLLQTMVWMI